MQPKSNHRCLQPSSHASHYVLTCRYLIGIFKTLFFRAHNEIIPTTNCHYHHRRKTMMFRLLARLEAVYLPKPPPLSIATVQWISKVDLGFSRLRVLTRSMIMNPLHSQEMHSTPASRWFYPCEGQKLGIPGIQTDFDGLWALLQIDSEF